MIHLLGPVEPGALPPNDVHLTADSLEAGHDELAAGGVRGRGQLQEAVRGLQAGVRDLKYISQVR